MAVHLHFGSTGVTLESLSNFYFFDSVHNDTSHSSSVAQVVVDSSTTSLPVQKSREGGAPAGNSTIRLRSTNPSRTGAVLRVVSSVPTFGHTSHRQVR